MSTTDTFAAESSDGYAGLYGGSPPANTLDVNQGRTDYGMLLLLGDNGTTGRYCGFVRFDTSALAGKKILSAELRLTPQYIRNANDLSIQADNFNWGGGTLDIIDLAGADPVASNAIAPVPVSALTVNVQYAFPVAPEVINRTGFTHFRLGYSVAWNASLGNNTLRFHAQEGTEADRRPVLAVTWEEPPGVPVAKHSMFLALL